MPDLPILDGPGVAMIVFMPILLFILTLPIFDVIAILEPLTRGDSLSGCSPYRSSPR